MSRLYVVATPIGNLGDISARALRILNEVPLIAAEDTRVAAVLLRHYGVKAKLLSYNDHNLARRVPELLDHLNAGDVALVTDAGTPAISDPGVDIVAAARSAGHEVVAVPGPSSPIAALSVAGLPTQRFVFLGFLPRTAGDLRRLLEDYGGRTETLVALESPQRVFKTLEAIATTLPERRVAVCRELTKLHEEVFLGTAAEAIAHFSNPRGEFVLVIEGAEAKPKTDELDDFALLAEVSEMRDLGLTRSQASALMTSRHGLPRRRVYELWLRSEA